MSQRIINSIAYYLVKNTHDLIKHRSLLFGETSDVHSLLQDAIRNKMSKLYADFFIDYWGLPEVQRHKETIIKVFIPFMQFNYFREGLIRMSITHDDAELFDRIMDNDPNFVFYSGFIKYDAEAYNDDLIQSHFGFDIPRSHKHYICLLVHKLVYKYKAWNICLHSKFKSVFKTFIEHQLYINRDYRSDILEYIEVASNKDEVAFLKYLHTVTESLPIAKHKSDFYHTYSNVVKFLLNDQNRMNDLDFHKFIMKHNNFSLIYDYTCANSNRHQTPRDRKHLTAALYEILLHKIKKGRYVLNAFIEHKWVLVNLYEKHPDEVMAYTDKIYEFIDFTYAKFLLGSIFNEEHKVQFHELMSKKRKGKLGTNERKKLYKKYLKKPHYPQK